jgi:hypothetical protein
MRCRTCGRICREHWGWLQAPRILISVRMIPSTSMDSHDFMIMRHYVIPITKMSRWSSQDYPNQWEQCSTEGSIGDCSEEDKPSLLGALRAGTSL